MSTGSLRTRPVSSCISRNGRLQRRLFVLDTTCNEVVPIRVITGHEYARSKFVSQHDFIAPWIMREYGDRIAPAP